MNLWQRLTTTRHTRALEAELGRTQTELVRLRAENRALLNSILGIAGVPPIPMAPPEERNVAENVSEVGSAATAAAAIVAPTQPSQAINGRARGTNAARSAPPMRRHSWHQITRMLELQSRKKAASD